MLFSVGWVDLLRDSLIPTAEPNDRKHHLTWTLGFQWASSPYPTVHLFHYMYWELSSIVPLTCKLIAFLWNPIYSELALGLNVLIVLTLETAMFFSTTSLAVNFPKLSATSCSLHHQILLHCHGDGSAVIMVTPGLVSRSLIFNLILSFSNTYFIFCALFKIITTNWHTLGIWSPWEVFHFGQLVSHTWNGPLQYFNLPYFL